MENSNHVLNKRVIDVAVATLWVSPEKLRPIDAPALAKPANVSRWVNTMTTEDKLELSGKNMVETQALYGTIVHVIEEQDDWARVVIPDQPSSKESRGYPGWLPKAQLADSSYYIDYADQPFAVVIKPLTYLYKSPNDAIMQISYQTRLPFLNQTDEWVTVATPDGPQYLKSEDVVIFNAAASIPRGTGAEIVSHAEMFLGLPYLWGGMSGFGFDCSGFTYTVHRALGMKIARDAHDQAAAGKEVSRETLLPGDLLFFSHDADLKRIHHVGIYIGNDQMLHSPNTPKAIEVITLTGTKHDEELCAMRRYWKEEL